MKLASYYVIAACQHHVSVGSNYCQLSRWCVSRCSSRIRIAIESVLDSSWWHM